jgi:hypothetical protein
MEFNFQCNAQKLKRKQITMATSRIIEHMRHSEYVISNSNFIGI